MKILIIKMSSLGDVVHTLPAISDILHHHPDAQIDWVVEEKFAETAAWHPGVHEVIPIALRRLRKQHPLSFFLRKPWRDFKALMQARQYDIIIDAQGLIKSALIARLPQGKRFGLSYAAARESCASYFYHQRIDVDKNCHAVLKLRQLFAGVLGYDIEKMPLVYGIKPRDWPRIDIDNHSVLLLHGTTWDTKLWPVEYWQNYAQFLADKGYRVYLPWGSDQEKQRAEKIATVHEKVQLLPRYNLAEMASVLLQVKFAVAVDTGLGHLAAALEVPCTSLYGPTSVTKTGTYGLNQSHLAAALPCAPCLQKRCKIAEPTDNDAAFPPCMGSLVAEKLPK